MTVNQLLKEKGRDLWTINPDATVLDALAKMAEKNIGSLVVMDGEELIGILTEDPIPGKLFSKANAPPPRGSGRLWRKT